jgi:hypothetical protein
MSNLSTRSDNISYERTLLHKSTYFLITVRPIALMLIRSKFLKVYIVVLLLISMPER